MRKKSANDKITINELETELEEDRLIAKAGNKIKGDKYEQLSPEELKRSNGDSKEIKQETIIGANEVVVNNNNKENDEKEKGKNDENIEIE